jgi:hypothetical protein
MGRRDSVTACGRSHLAGEAPDRPDWARRVLDFLKDLMCCAVALAEP